MSLYYYLSLVPEALIVSMLPPEDFGRYYALGAHHRNRGQAMFFEVDAEKAGSALPREDAERRCVPHSDGRPKNSTYLQVYRALEKIPTGSLKRLHLTTHDGKTLSLEPGDTPEPEEREWHLYQEICPVHPRVASRLDPQAFGQALTKEGQPTSVPRLVYADMKLENLALDPEALDVGNLPYTNLQHLRDCLLELKNIPSKSNKTVNRSFTEEVLFRTVRQGFFVADQSDFRFFPMPDVDVLETDHYPWWRSALAGSIG